jgi:hypothetical protein
MINGPGRYMTEQEVPPEAPLTHIYETNVYRDNRGYEVHERVNTFGVAPRSFPPFIGKVTLPVPTRLPNGRTDAVDMPFFCALRVKTVQEGFERFREFVEPAFKEFYEKRVAELNGGPKIMTARRMPRPPVGG